jgi:C-terminal processing protease CtpA/Prc
VIVNEETQSLGELTAMALRSVPGAITIGTRTAGADGYVSLITLPGNIRTQISGLGVMNVDSTETQRAGVKIDRVVPQTINGFRKGRDEQLEAALELIRK